MDFAAVLRDVGRRVADLRADRGLTQEQLASVLGAGPAYIRRVEAGSKGASLHQIARIADALGAPLHELFVAPRSREARPAGRPPRAPR